MKVGFIGLGHMGLAMASNLVQRGFDVIGYDLNPDAIAALVHKGGRAAMSIECAVDLADAVITMLPEGRHVQSVYFDDGIFAHVRDRTLLIDCSTTDMETTRAIHSAASKRYISLIDAPVSGGMRGANLATLTFMVGGDLNDLDRSTPILKAMGQTIIHTGPAGTGQAAKICNNLILGISMTAVSEAFVLAEKLGLSAAKFFDVASQSSGQCWSMTSYCPVPELVPTSPANNDYVPGFSAAMMLKDLRLAKEASKEADVYTPLTAAAAALYEQLINDGFGEKDFSYVIRYIENQRNTFIK